MILTRAQAPRSGNALGSFLVITILFLIATPMSAQTWTATGGNLYNNPTSSFVGIGVSNPFEKLHVFGNVDGNVGLRFENSSSGTAAQSLVFLYNDLGWSAMTLTGSNAGNIFRIQSNSAITGGIVVRTLANADISIAPNDVTALTVKGNGNVGIGTTAPTAKLSVVGDATFSGTVSGGNIQAKYQDIAEWVPAGGELPAGTVVVLDTDRSNAVEASSVPYDTLVAGVISAQPGVLLGEGGEGMVKVATTGRVKVRVESAKGVKVGDLLVTSDKVGTATVSQPIIVAGASLHRPGTLIGKALESMAPGTGEILVLLSLQ